MRRVRGRARIGFTASLTPIRIPNDFKNNAGTVDRSGKAGGYEKQCDDDEAVDLRGAVGTVRVGGGARGASAERGADGVRAFASGELRLGLRHQPVREQRRDGFGAVDDERTAGGELRLRAGTFDGVAAGRDRAFGRGGRSGRQQQFNESGVGLHRRGDAVRHHQPVDHRGVLQRDEHGEQGELRVVRDLQPDHQFGGVHGLVGARCRAGTNRRAAELHDRPRGVRDHCGPDERLSGRASGLFQPAV